MHAVWSLYLAFRLPHGGAAQGAGILSSSTASRWPASSWRLERWAGPLAPTSRWPALTPPACSFRGSRRKWLRDPRGLGAAEFTRVNGLTITCVVVSEQWLAAAVFEAWLFA
ncbi:unnamed protein product [Pipistrellus nathusii]|uniref:Secreted protein n=1 Tax=Pipistrellus nathusii TaxID=59473 RepID=A0ABP0A9S8_PIPNA